MKRLAVRCHPIDQVSLHNLIMVVIQLEPNNIGSAAIYWMLCDTGECKTPRYDAIDACRRLH